MSANATGTPTTNFSIPKFNTASDAPNGKGVNEMMDAIDTLVADPTKVPSNKMAGLVANDVPVWNGTTWVRVSGTSGTNKVLRGDGSWASRGWEPIQAQTLGADNAITFSAIPATYSALQVVGHLRGATAAVTTSAVVRFNNDTGATYDYQYIDGSAAVVSSAASTAQTFALFAHIFANSASAGIFSPVEVLIPQYAGTQRFKTYIGRGGAGSSTVLHATGDWDSTVSGNAITTVSLLDSSAGNLKAGSWAMLLGLTS